MTKIIDCKNIAATMLNETSDKVSYLPRMPFLAGIRTEGDAPSASYAAGIKKDCNKYGIFYAEYVMNANDSTDSWNKRIAMLNDDVSVDGIIIFQPAPKDLIPIAPSKDVDASSKTSFHTPCTAEAAMIAIKNTGIQIEGKYAVVVGRSNNIGRPIANCLLNKNATVTVCHSFTKNLEKYTSEADILISAAGHPELIGDGMIKPGATVIDVGTTKTENGVCGDVSFSAACKDSEYMTMVPGGVGLITRAVLIKHVVDSACQTMGVCS